MEWSLAVEARQLSDGEHRCLTPRCARVFHRADQSEKDDCLATSRVVFIADRPNRCAVNLKTLARCGDANACVVVDEAIRGDAGEHGVAFFPEDRLCGEAGGHGGEGRPVGFPELQGTAVAIVEERIVLRAVGGDHGFAVPKSGTERLAIKCCPARVTQRLAGDPEVAVAQQPTLGGDGIVVGERRRGLGHGLDLK